MTSLVDINPDHLKVVQEILRENLPSGVAVWAFGSRANWTTKDSSDLDLVLKGDSALDHGTIVALETAFEESSLPYKVDVVDLNQISNSFRRVIETQMVPFQLPNNLVNSESAWSESVLGNVLTLQRGFDLPHNKRVPGPFPVIASTEQVGLHKEAKVKGPGVVIGRSGSLGGAQYITNDFWPLNTTLWVKDFKKNDRLFCYYLLKSFDLSTFNAGSGVPTLNRNHIHALPLQLPPLTEQRSIAHILGTLDNKIELNRRMNQTLEEMARTLFKSWFVDFDPVRAKMAGRWQRGESFLGLPAEYYNIFPDRLVNSELGEIPEEWQVKCLKEFANLNSESWSQTNHPSSVEYVDLANTKWGMIELTQHFSWENAPSRAKRVLRPGDTIIGTVRPGNGSYSFIGIDGMTASTGFAVLRPIYAWSRELVYLSVTDRGNIERLAHRADGAAYPAVHPEVVAETKVVVPVTNKSILRCFSNIVGPILDKIELAKEASRTLAGQRAVLLPKLMSGKLRVETKKKHGE